MFYAHFKNIIDNYFNVDINADDKISTLVEDSLDAMDFMFCIETGYAIQFSDAFINNFDYNMTFKELSSKLEEGLSQLVKESKGE